MAIAGQTRWFLVSCSSCRRAAALCPYKYSPDMTQQGCSQCKYRERKSCLTTLSSCDDGAMWEMWLNYGQKPARLAVNIVAWWQSTARGKCKERVFRWTSKSALEGSKSMCNGLCGDAAALVTVHRALKGKQRGKRFPKAGKAKEKEFKPQFLQHLFIRHISFCCEGDIWLWRIQSCLKSWCSSESFSLKIGWKTSRSCFSLLQQTHGFHHQLRSDMTVYLETPCANKVRNCSLRQQGHVCSEVLSECGSTTWPLRLLKICG